MHEHDDNHVVRLRSLATAVPRHVLLQEEVRSLVGHLFKGAGEISRLLPVFEKAGIATRHSAVALDWYVKPHGWVERNSLYLDNAVGLLEVVARRALTEAGIDPGAIDTVVVVSSTGIATPSLDALLMERIALRRDVERLPIFGLGCVGGVLGLTRAASLARACPGSHVLFLAVELCGLWFRHDDLAKSNIIAAALFADGAAGAVLSCRGLGPRLGPGGEHTWPASLDVVGWTVAKDGLEAFFSVDIPSIVRRDLRPVAANFLGRHGLSFDDIGAFVCHPGGVKVLAALENAFALAQGALVEARHVLRDYGNMSSVSVLFVLQRLLRKDIRRRMMMAAFGPGFTVGFLLVDNR